MLKMLCLFSAKNINNYLSQPNVKFGLINLDLIFLK